MHRVESDDVLLAVHEFSDESHVDVAPLLLAHATGFHGLVWRAVAEQFPERRTLAPDFRGFGDSTMSTSPLSWHDFARDVLAVIDHFDLTADGPLDAIGHSKGGAALVLAELARPGTFRRLVLFEPIIFPEPGAVDSADSGDPPDMATVARRRRTRFDSIDAAVARFGSKPPLGSLRPDVLWDYVTHGFAADDDGSIELKASPEHEADTYETARGHGTFERLGDIGCPVLVVASGDGAGPAMLGPMVAERLPRGRLETMDDLGHFGPLEDPIAFATLARRVLRSGGSPVSVVPPA